MKKQRRGDTFGYTLRIPNDIKPDLDLLAKYHYASYNTEMVNALRQYIESNREIIEQERKRFKELEDNQ